MLYAGPFGGAVDGVGVGILMRFRVRAAMGSSLFVMLLFILGVG